MPEHDGQRLIVEVGSLGSSELSLLKGWKVIRLSIATPPSAVKSRAISCTHGGPHGTAGSAALRKARSSLRSQSAVSPSRTSPAIEMKSQSKAPSKPMTASTDASTTGRRRRRAE